MNLVGASDVRRSPWDRVDRFRDQWMEAGIRPEEEEIEVGRLIDTALPIPASGIETMAAM